MFVVFDGLFINDFKHMLNAPGLEMRHDRSKALSERLATGVLECQFNNANENIAIWLFLKIVSRTYLGRRSLAL